MEIVVIVLLIFFNGLLSLSEISLISSRRVRISSLSKENKRGSKKALSLIENPDKYLSTIQVGITLIGILTGVYSGDTIANELKITLAKFPHIAVYAGVIAKTIVVVVITYITIVFGELIPKKIGMAFPETILRLSSGFLSFFSVVFAPFVWILVKTIDLVMRVFHIQVKEEAKITEEEILAAVKMGAKEGEVQDVEQDIVERVFDLGDRDVASVMTHRNDLICIDVNASIDDVKILIYNDMHSCYPVVDKHLDNLVGVISLKNLLDCLLNEKWNIISYVEKPNFLPENTSTYNAMEHFKKTQVYYAFVSDEFGSLQGMITSVDIMEALLGRMSEHDEDEETIEQYGENTWIVDGQYSFYDFLTYFDMEDDYQEFDYNTLSGLILDILERIPAEGELIEWKNFQFEISKIDGARIDKVIVRKFNTEEDIINQ